MGDMSIQNGGKGTQLDLSREQSGHSGRQILNGSWSTLHKGHTSQDTNHDSLRATLNRHLLSTKASQECLVGRVDVGDFGGHRVKIRVGQVLIIVVLGIPSISDMVTTAGK